MWLGMCDKVRRTPEGEALWERMMATRMQITEKAFLRRVNPARILDEGETWEERFDSMQTEDPSTALYKAADGLFFIQTCGFEYIWRQDGTRLEKRKERKTV